MQRQQFKGFVVAGLVFAAINTFSFFTLDQPIGIGGFMGWIPSAVVASCNEAFARAKNLQLLDVRERPHRLNPHGVFLPHDEGL